MTKGDATGTSHRSGSVYITLMPGRYALELRAIKATSVKPRATPEGSVVVKLNLRVPTSAFAPLEPATAVTIPAEFVEIPAVDVEPEDANDDKRGDSE